MSTRGLIGFRIGGIDKVTYNHSDSYPSWLGRQTLQFFRTAQADQLAKVAAGIKLVDEEKRLTKAQRQSVAKYLENEPSSRDDWYNLLREAQGEWDYWYQGLPYMIDYQGFFYGFNCEWCYVYDVDAQQLEIYSNAYEERGLGRYNHKDGEGDDETIGVRLLMTVPLATMQGLTDDQIDFLCQVLKDQDEGQWHERSDKSLKQCAPLKGSRGTTDWHPFDGDWQVQIVVAGNDTRFTLRKGDLRVESTVGDGLLLDHPGYGDALASLLDETVRSYAIAIYGPKATVSHYRKVMRFRKALSLYDVDATGLPLLQVVLDNHPALKLKLTASYFEKLKALFLKEGLTNQAWKFMLGQPSGSLGALIGELGFDYEFGKTVKLLNVMATAMQVEPLVPERIAAALRAVERVCGISGYSSASGWTDRSTETMRANAAIFVRTLMRAEITEEEAENLDSLAADISDYVRNVNSVLDGVTWNSLKRRSQEWHLKAEIAKLEKENRVWESRLGVYAAGEYLALELNSAKLLAEEGVEMHHCVKSYADDCEAGTSRIFSLRKQGERAATVELRCDDGETWSVGQVRGRFNAVFPSADPVMTAARSLSNAYTGAARKAATPIVPLPADAASMQLRLF